MDHLGADAQKELTNRVRNYRTVTAGADDVIAEIDGSFTVTVCAPLPLNVYWNVPIPADRLKSPGDVASVSVLVMRNGPV